MAERTRFKLNIPDDVTCLDLGILALKFLKSGKMVLIKKETTDGRKSPGGVHVTLHPGNKTGIMDAHLTDPTAQEPHQTLFAIRRDGVEELTRIALPHFDNFLRTLIGRDLPARAPWLASASRVLGASVLAVQWS